MIRYLERDCRPMETFLDGTGTRSVRDQSSPPAIVSVVSRLVRSCHGIRDPYLYWVEEFPVQAMITPRRNTLFECSLSTIDRLTKIFTFFFSPGTEEDKRTVYCPHLLHPLYSPCYWGSFSSLFYFFFLFVLDLVLFFIPFCSSLLEIYSCHNVFCRGYYTISVRRHV